MKKIFFILFSISIFSISANSAVVKGYDQDSRCDLYKVVTPDSSGKIRTQADETIIYAKDVYGFSFQDMEINFDNKEVLVTPIINIVLGLNRPLINAKAIIESDHKDFKFLINQLNRKINLFEKVCISNSHIVYAKVFEPQTQTLRK